MKYFKLIGDQNQWPSFEEGRIYPASSLNGPPIGLISEIFPEDFIQVPKPKKSLSERIEKLRKEAKKEGFNCEVVLDRKEDEIIKGCFAEAVKKSLEGIKLLSGIKSEPILESKANFVKDEWDKVEYVERISSGNLIYSKTVGTISKLPEPHEKGKYYKPYSFTADYFENNFKPSTEQAYVDQLKAKAKELYGEIKEGDRFDIDGLTDKIKMYCDEWDYEKDLDLLLYLGCPIYFQGKWATKLPKKIEVKIGVPELKDFIKTRDEYMGLKFSFDLELTGSDSYDITAIRDFLAKQLESYLNKETE